MIDLNRWIYSKNIAAWLTKNVSLNLEKQINCICAAHHRMLEEKLEGLKELKSKHDGKALQDRIENIEMVLYYSRTDTAIYPYLFGTEIFYQGVLVNVTEPDEENFLDDPYNQWLIYPTLEHRDQTHGIGFVNLRDDYIPFGNSPDFFPYKQLIDVYEGDLKENEMWLSEFSVLIKADKNCIRKILHDREPKNYRYLSMNEERLKYVRELAAK